MFLYIFQLIGETCNNERHQHLETFVEELLDENKRLKVEVDSLRKTIVNMQGKLRFILYIYIVLSSTRPNAHLVLGV